eukprot:212406_1
MDGKPTNTFILLTFLLLGHTINSQTGEGCPNTNTACPAGQVRMNAIYNPSGAFIGGCNCFVIYCAFPRVYDTNSQTCQCSNRPRYGCPYHQFFNEDTCQCECIELQIPGSDLLTCIENTQPEPIVRPDCSCECLLPGCPANKFLNEQRCECQCPPCSLSNQMIIDQNTCQCGPKPITITTTTTRAPPPPPPTTTTTTTIPPLTQPNTNNGPQVIDPPIIKVITTTPPQHINTNPPHTTIAHGGGGGGGGHGTTIPPGTKAPYIPHCCQPKMSKFA